MARKKIQEKDISPAEKFQRVEDALEQLSIVNRELSLRNEQLSYSSQYADAIITTIREPLLVLNKDLRVKTANFSFYNTFGGSVERTQGELFYELQNGQWDIPELRNLLERNLKEKTFYDSYELKQNFHLLGVRTVLLNVRRILAENDSEQLILLAFEDVTDCSWPMLGDDAPVW